MNTHEYLMQLFREYFKQNQDWESSETHAAGMRCRALLAEIRIVARKRRAEIQEVRHKKAPIKSPKYRQSLLKDKGNDKA
jgi:hypothetical protein